MQIVVVRATSTPATGDRRRQRRRQEMNLLRFLSFLFLSGLILVSASEDELRSLLEFKKGIQQDPLQKVLNSWIPSSVVPYSCPQSFYGVSCDENGNVSSILLDNLGLVGDLKFNTLNGLTMLKNLSLSGNYFTGRLVSEFGFMTSLQYLDLSGNMFYGTFPPRMYNLWGLTYLNLSSNNFSGVFPSGIESLQQLKVLDVHSNDFSGYIQVLFSELRNVEIVDLSNNRFNGSLSMESYSISGLANTARYLNLGQNMLGGEFFSSESISLFRNLQVLDLSDNQLTGELPSFDSLPSLRILRLGDNQLSGTIPEELFENLLPLEELDLSSNLFSGNVGVINSTTLKTLNLSSNALSGSLPSSVGQSVIMDLSQNAFSGDLSVMQMWDSSSLELLDLSSNNISGTIPSSSSKFQNLITLIIRNNSLVGNLPPHNSPRLSQLDLSMNKLGGSIPPSLFTSITLSYLNLSGNRFTGSIPFQVWNSHELLLLPNDPPLEFLDLSYNSLTGELPSDISYNLGRLKFMNLAVNNLLGKIPGELSKLGGLEYLDLSRNNFIGPIPTNLPSSLAVLNLSYNNLSGFVSEDYLRKFPIGSFRPGNVLLIFPSKNDTPVGVPRGGSINNRSWRSRLHVIIIVSTILATIMIAFILLAIYRVRKCSQPYGGNAIIGRFSGSSLSKLQEVNEPTATPTSLSFSQDRLLISNPTPLSDHWEASTSATIVSSPDRLVGELVLLDDSLALTNEDLSGAMAEVLGKSSYGTLYKANMGNGNVLTVKWLRVGMVKHGKEFAREVKKIGSIVHPSIVPIRAYYLGKREERLILCDYIHGDNLALHLHETTVPGKYISQLSLRQRLKIAVDIARCLTYLHDRGLPHGNLKPTNIILKRSTNYNNNLEVRLADYGLHRFLTLTGISTQILNLGALGYLAPELAKPTSKRVMTLKSDVYSFGVILMELLTRRSAGDIISGQLGSVDLTDWVQVCYGQGRGRDCVDRDIIVSGEEEGLDELLAIAVKCVSHFDERPNMGDIFNDVSSISI
ncbi:probable inactive receptor kinase At5g10020 [Impatiens glandulifera]|uniref:probable inactive receptor kinase At5g10020 n=1 Tax=Impatiens glandulifera TaxID=253017 RepID=UPI001FB1100D|nr:probable inactive receptor kinase At5g10020 [Impatiens glandulifera]